MTYGYKQVLFHSKKQKLFYSFFCIKILIFTYTKEPNTCKNLHK